MELFRTLISSLVDALPPYREVDGPLEKKEAGRNGTGYIHLGSERIEVDAFTLDTLYLGERIRVRFTRGKKAISIDRYIPDQSE